MWPTFQLTQRHEQRNGGTRCNTRQLEITDDGPACCVATDQADAGQQGDDGHQDAGQDGAQISQNGKNFHEGGAN